MLHCALRTSRLSKERDFDTGICGEERLWRRENLEAGVCGRKGVVEEGDFIRLWLTFWRMGVMVLERLNVYVILILFIQGAEVFCV